MSIADWSHIHTETTVKLIEEYFHFKKQRAAIDEIHQYVITKRPSTPKESIAAYLYEKDIFTRVSTNEYELSVWGSKPHHSTGRGRSMTERIKPVVERFFENIREQEIPLSELVREIEIQTEISNSNIYVWLKKSGIVHVYQDRNNPSRKLVKYENAQPSMNQETRTTLRQRVQEEIRRYLSTYPDARARLADAANYIMKKVACKKHTFYSYVSEMDDVKKEKVNGIIYCYLTGETERASLPFIFPQLSQITEEPLRSNIERAVALLTIDNVDVGLFQLGKIFEGELKEFLLEAHKKQAFNVSKKDLGRLFDMIDCVIREGVIGKKHELSFLREERNERAHGKIPLQEEREKLFKYAPFLAGLYIDYVIIFHKERLRL